MISYRDIDELEKSLNKPESIKVIKNLLYIFTGILVLYIIYSNQYH